jgi:predicted protein tyrosine phosphatase
MTSIALPQLTICGLEELDDHSTRQVTHVLSILDPEWPEPAAFLAYEPHHRRILHFHDEILPSPGMQLPHRAHVEEILTFGRSWQRDLASNTDAHLLIHCHAGISRSTAAMTALLAQARPDRDEDSVVEHIAHIRPKAWPNWLMIGFADAILERDGRLKQAVRRLYGRRLAARPELADVMRRLNRQPELDMALMPEG